MARLPYALCNVLKHVCVCIYYLQNLQLKCSDREGFLQPHLKPYTKTRKKKVSMHAQHKYTFIKGAIKLAQTCPIHVLIYRTASSSQPTPEAVAGTHGNASSQGTSMCIVKYCTRVHYKYIVADN